MHRSKHINYKVISAFLVICSFFFILSRNYFARENTAEDVPGMPNIIICTLGGVRNSETINDESHQYISNLWNNMLKYGTLYTNLVNLNLPFHQPSILAINTGKTMSSYSNLKVPSVFQYVIKQYNLPSSKVWSVGHWNTEDTIAYIDQVYDVNTIPGWVRFAHVSPEAEELLNKQELNSIRSFNKLVNQDDSSDSRKFSGRINFSWSFWDINNELRYRIVKKILNGYKPKIMHFVMDGTDSAHYDTFGRYVLAIKDADERIFDIWKYIQSDPFYKDNTYLFVTSDHGRDRYYMQHSEYDSTGQTWLYVYGPKIKKDIKIDRAVHHTDIFATIAHILNLKTHPIDGKVLEDCFL